MFEKIIEKAGGIVTTAIGTFLGMAICKGAEVLIKNHYEKKCREEAAEE